jgi:hypothetical protein
MESTNQTPAYLINMRGIRCFSNQVENFLILRDGDIFVLIGSKIYAVTRTRAKRLRRKSIVSPDSRPLDTIKLGLAQDNIIFIHDKGIGFIMSIYKQ